MAEEVHYSGGQLIRPLSGERVDSVDYGPASIIGGTATGGVLRAHTLQLPWNYSQTESPTDVSVGTALHVPMDVTIGTPFAPAFSTTHWGQRGIINLEGPVRYTTNMTIFGFAPVGYGDFLTITNEPSGVARNLAPAWSFVSARSHIAHGATCNLEITDVADAGADFVASTLFGSMDGGHLDGTANAVEHVNFMTLFTVQGQVTLERHVGFDMRDILAADPGTVSAFFQLGHWDLPGDFDVMALTIGENIGLRVAHLRHGTRRAGMVSQHGIHLFTEDVARSDLDTLGFVGLNYGAALDGTQATLTADAASWTAPFISHVPLIVFSEDSFGFGTGPTIRLGATYRNANGEAQTLAFLWGVNTGHAFTADAATLTANSVVGFRDGPTFGVINSGVLNATSVTSFEAAAQVNASATVTTRRGLLVDDAGGSGTVTTQVGVDIAALAKGGTNIGLRNASTEVATPSVATLAAASSSITPNAKVKRLDNTSGGPLTLTSAPTIADGQDGQILVLFNGSANAVTLQDQGTLASSNLRLSAATVALGTRDSIMLMFSSTVGDWIELGTTNVL